MTLYLEEGGFQPWAGEPIDGIRYPINIEQLWTDDELAAINLYRPVVPAVPFGKVVTHKTVQRVDGVVTFVYTLNDGQTAPPDPLQTKLAEMDAKLARFELVEAALIKKAILTSDDISKARL